jgi:hypothetical protein
VHASKMQHAQLPEDVLPGEASRAASLHLVPTDEEVSHMIIDVMVDGAVRRQPCAVAKVRRQPRRSLFSWSRTAGHVPWLPGTNNSPTLVLSRCTLFVDGLAPRYPYHPPSVPSSLPRRIERVRASIASPFTRPSPLFRRVGIRTFTFEACSSFTRITARRVAQPPKGGLCHEASTQSVTQPSRSSATRSIDNSLDGTFLHWCYAPSRRTE